MNKLTVTLAFLFSVISLSDLIAQGVADTPENRQREAERYLQATPPKAMIGDLVDRATMNVPPADREKFKQTMTSALDNNAIHKAITEEMVKHFTAEELKGLADFYSSPTGKSALDKFRPYTADLMPRIQAEMMKAKDKATRSAPNK